MNVHSVSTIKKGRPFTYCIPGLQRFFITNQLLISELLLVAILPVYIITQIEH